MYLYARILQILGYFNLIICSIFYIYGSFFTDSIRGGTNLNLIGCIIQHIGFSLMMILMGIFQIQLGEEVAEELLAFNKGTTYVCIILLINFICRMFFNDGLLEENGVTFTAAKLLAGLSAALLLNFILVIQTTNYLKNK